MAIDCIDISENKKIGTVSPLAIMAFVCIYVVLTAFMEPGFTYVLLLLVSYILTNLFFQFTPRFIFLYLKFLFTASYLTPTFKDENYISDHKKINSLKPLLPLENAKQIDEDFYN